VNGPRVFGGVMVAVVDPGVVVLVTTVEMLVVPGLRGLDAPQPAAARTALAAMARPRGRIRLDRHGNIPGQCAA
jgi:hypothetical protein